jgi:predicted XRE-type DNA-binding protein
MRRVVFEADTLARLREFPETVRQRAGYEIDRIQTNLEAENWKAIPTTGSNQEAFKMMVHEFDSVWDAIETDTATAANLRLRSRLMMAVSEYVKQSGLTQAEAARRLGTTQPRLNDVLKGKIEKCTVDRLVIMLAAVGYTVNLDISNAA